MAPDEPLSVGPNVPTQELEIVTYILRIFEPLPQDSRRRIIETVIKFFDLQLDRSASVTTSTRSVSSPALEEPSGSLSSFSEDRSISPKQFMLQKQPRTDVEKVACLAYYLTHYRNTPYFKTLDISTLNTEAAQAKFSNAAVSVDNATKRHYLVPGTKGNKQLSALGEQFVLALPDRDKAREVMVHTRPRRRTGREKINRSAE